MPTITDFLYPNDSLYSGDLTPELEGYNFYNLKLKQAGDSLLYTPGGIYSNRLKKNGQGQSFNTQLLAIIPILEEDGSLYFLLEDNSTMVEEG